MGRSAEEFGKEAVERQLASFGMATSDFLIQTGI